MEPVLQAARIPNSSTCSLPVLRSPLQA